MAFIQNVLIVLLGLYVFTAPVFSEATTLSNPEEIRIYEEVTSKVRCICLPSLPIKSCSYNNCSISAYIKLFLENRIKQKEDAKTLLYKMEHGFGEDILSDPIIARFVQDGNQQVVESLVYGFGPKILAEPDSTMIDLTIILIALLSIISIFYYLKKRRGKATDTGNSSGEEINGVATRYLEELNEEQR